MDKISNSKTFRQQVNNKTYSRINHRTIATGRHALLFGGTNKDGQLQSTVLRVDCQNLEVETLHTSNSLPMEGFSLFSYGKMFYLWGGRKNGTMSNSLWCFNGQSFLEKSQHGDIPAARAFHSSIFFGGRYLITYGGVSDNSLFLDWHLFDCATMSWKKLKPNIHLPFNIDTHMLWSGGHGTLILSEIMENSQPHYCTLIYQFRITDFMEGILNLEPLKLSFVCPQPRANPILASYFDGELYILFIGGERLRIDLNQVYSDIWVLRLETLEWQCINSIQIQPIFGSQIISYQKKILLLGGCTKQSCLSEQITVIQFPQSTSLQAKICGNCSNIYGLKDEPDNLLLRCEYEQPFKISIQSSFLHKISNIIKNPLSALALLIDNSLNMHATKVSLRVRSVTKNKKFYKNDIRYIQLLDNSCEFSRHQILEYLFCYGCKAQTYTNNKLYEQQIRLRKEYGTNMKLGSLRLGRSYLYITKTIEEQIIVYYFSSILNNAPSNKNHTNCFYYYLSEGIVSDVNDRRIIQENMIHLMKKQEYQYTKQFTSKLFIMDLDPEDQLNNLITYNFNHQNTKLKFTLTSYIKYLYLNPFFGRQLEVEGQQLNFCDLLKDYRKAQLEGKLKIVYNLGANEIFKQIQLYEIIQACFNSQILVYHLNRLIKTIDTQQRRVCGLIEIPDEIQVDLSKNQLEKLSDQKKMVELIEKILDSKKRNSQHTFNAKPTKKLKLERT